MNILSLTSNISSENIWHLIVSLELYNSELFNNIILHLILKPQHAIKILSNAERMEVKANLKFCGYRLAYNIKTESKVGY